MQNTNITQLNNINITLLNKFAKAPVYATTGSSGADLFCSLEAPISIQPGKHYLVPTGIAIELEGNIEAQIRPRSGLALKHGIMVLNSPGTIDTDYRGEIKVILMNLGEVAFTVNPGDRIAQIIFSNYIKANFTSVNLLSSTNRSDGGFGSSGT